MKQRILAFAVALLALGGGLSAANASCTATGFYQDRTNLTAAMINPAGTVSGDVDATGCDIGIYYTTSGTVDQANIHNATYYGVLNNGGVANVTNSSIHDIGDSPLSGSQHGVGVYFAVNAVTAGIISGNVIRNYQKGGIVVSGPNTTSTVQIFSNVVIGQGPNGDIVQNGIQVGFGAQTGLWNNTVVANSFTGATQASATGILVVGGSCFGGADQMWTQINNNFATENDVGVWFVNAEGGFPICTIPTMNTHNGAAGNTIWDNAVYNTNGHGPGQAYQAGIADIGVDDVITTNSICGFGYTPAAPPLYLHHIDTSEATTPVVTSNFCDAATISPDFVMASKTAGHGGMIKAKPQPYK